MKRYLKCPLCGVKIVVYGKSARAWHGACIVRRPRDPDPEYVEDDSP